jgi:hypothetical protein
VEFFLCSFLFIWRILNIILEEERTAFLKGIMVGVAVRKAVDELEETDLTDENPRPHVCA